MKEPFKKAFTESKEKSVHGKEKKMGKRGQVTPFIIIGIFIVVIAVVLIFFARPRIPKVGIVSTAQIDPIRDYVEECMRISLEDSLVKLDRYAGYFDDGYVHFYADCDGLSFLVYDDKDESNTKNVIADKIGEKVIEYLKTPECSLDKFNEQFGGIVIGEPELFDVEIGMSNIQVKVKYPIKIEKSNISLNEISLIHNTDFGALYELVRMVTQGDEYDINEYNEISGIFFGNHAEYQGKLGLEEDLDNKICVSDMGVIGYKVFPMFYDGDRKFKFGVTKESFV